MSLYLLSTETSCGRYAHYTDTPLHNQATQIQVYRLINFRPSGRQKGAGGLSMVSMCDFQCIFIFLREKIASRSARKSVVHSKKCPPENLLVGRLVPLRVCTMMLPLRVCTIRPPAQEEHLSHRAVRVCTWLVPRADHGQIEGCVYICMSHEMTLFGRSHVCRVWLVV